MFFKNLPPLIHNSILCTLLQGKPSYSESFPGGCLYRGNEGCRCAIGWMIPDDQYDFSLEGQSIESWEEQGILELPEDEIAILYVLQSCHDDYNSKEDFREGFIKNIREFLLTETMEENHECIFNSVKSALDYWEENSTFLVAVNEALIKVYMQGCVSKVENKPNCMYRDDNGACCAVGHLIKDEYYTPSLEGVTSFNINVRISIEKSLDIILSKSQVQILKYIQSAHDSISILGRKEMSVWEFRKQFIIKLESLIPKSPECEFRLPQAFTYTLEYLKDHYKKNVNT